MRMPFELPHSAALSPVSCEIIASLAIDASAVARFDLLMDVHPEEQRPLTEMEQRGARLAPLLVRGTPLAIEDAFGKSLALWSKYWPSWPWYDSVDVDIMERWRSLMPNCTALSVAYFFCPTGPLGGDLRDAYDQKYRDTFEAVNRIARSVPLSADRVTWTTQFATGSNPLLTAAFEELCGLTSHVKARIGLDEQHAGLLLRYAIAHQQPLEELLNPRQFEHFVADIYRADGWDCVVTRHTKDGGIDVEARRTVDGIPTVTLIQAKLYRSKGADGRRGNPVEIDEVKAFAATVRGEGYDQGLVVTSSSITKDARDWADTKGRNVAMLRFLDGANLRERLFSLGKGCRTGDIAAYVLHLESRDGER